LNRAALRSLGFSQATRHNVISRSVGNSATGIAIADDEKAYAYSNRRVLSALHIAQSWR